MEKNYSEDEIYKKIEEIVKKYSNAFIYEKDIKMTDDFESLGLNSLQYLKIVVEIESEFDIELDDENLDNKIFKNIENLSNYVKKLIKD
ncbi:acyl carrier protein [Clostridium sp.]|uniref:acyl carrier protein n=1 Tax=Clostridium sp. TaxID=1506 RepID=UPI002601AFD6|nr:acyl carrier protein [Clostridium sp.]